VDQASATLLAASIAAVAAVVSTIIGYVLNRRQERLRDELNRKQELLKDQLESNRVATEQLRGAVLQAEGVLRKSRMDAYRRLWACLRRFPRDAPEPLPSSVDLADARDELVTWYYEVGGLVMPRPTQRVCFVLTMLLDRLAEEQVTPDGYRDLFTVASALRTHTTVDVYSRATSSLAPDSDRAEADRRADEVSTKRGIEPPISREPESDRMMP
jgi:hypothetical protein